MCIKEEQIKQYEGLLQDIMIDTNEEGVTCAFLANNSIVLIDEKQKPPRAILCNNHEFQPGCCEAMQAVNYYYLKIAGIFAKEETEEKQPVVRYTIPEQNNRVEYDVLGSCKQHYHTVQMTNGRAVTCVDHVGAKCLHRQFKPGVPCSHMEKANQTEEQYRQQQQVEAYVQRYGFPEPILTEFKQLVQTEFDKCTEAFRAVTRQPIDEIKGTKEWWDAAEEREKKANKARLKQRKISQERINAFVQQQQEAVAA